MTHPADSITTPLDKPLPPFPKVQTPCPACGNRTLVVGNGAHLHCTTAACPDKVTERVIKRMRESITPDLAVDPVWSDNPVRQITSLSIEYSYLPSALTIVVNGVPMWRDYKSDSDMPLFRRIHHYFWDRFIGGSF